jgi:hypothetical protein
MADIVTIPQREYRMTDAVTFPCEYLFFTSGYEDRLLEEDKVEELSQFCAARGIIPIALSLTRGRMRVIPVRNGRIDMTVNPTDEETTSAFIVVTRIEGNGLALMGGIIFRVGNFENASKTFLSMSELNYCYIFGIDSIKFLANTERAIEIVVVKADAESG